MRLGFERTPRRVASFVWDQLFGTFYPSPKNVPRSATIFNLGDTDGESERFPWVRELSEPEVGMARARGEGDAL